MYEFSYSEQVRSKYTPLLFQSNLKQLPDTSNAIYVASYYLCCTQLSYFSSLYFVSSFTVDLAIGFGLRPRLVLVVFPRSQLFLLHEKDNRLLQLASTVYNFFHLKQNTRSVFQIFQNKNSS